MPFKNICTSTRHLKSLFTFILLTLNSLFNLIFQFRIVLKILFTFSPFMQTWILRAQSAKSIRHKTFIQENKSPKVLSCEL